VADDEQVSLTDGENCIAILSRVFSKLRRKEVIFSTLLVAWKQTGFNQQKEKETGAVIYS
jgi:hypothetical protein